MCLRRPFTVLSLEGGNARFDLSLMQSLKFTTAIQSEKNAILFKSTIIPPIFRPLHIKPRPLLLHPPLPLPLLPTPKLHPPIYPPQLQRKPRPNLLHADLYVLHALNRLAVVAQYRFLGLALVAEDVAVPPHEDVVALVVQGEDLAALEFGGGWKQAFPEVCGEDSKGGFEAVEYELRVVACEVAISISPLTCVCICE
jgi:hypothetical protein